MTSDERRLREKTNSFLRVMAIEPSTESGLGKLAIDAIFARRSGVDIARALLAVLDEDTPAVYRDAMISAMCRAIWPEGKA